MAWCQIPNTNNQSNAQPGGLEASTESQHLNTLRHEPAVVSCPSCNELIQTRIERVANSNPRFWPFNLCRKNLPCLRNDPKDTIHKCGKCGRPLAMAKRNGHTEAVLPVAIRRTVSREELSRPRSARLPNVPNFSRPGTAQSRMSRNLVSDPEFQSRFPPPLPDMSVVKEKMPLSVVIKNAHGMGASDSVVELPHVSPKSLESLTRSSAESSNASAHESANPEHLKAPSTSSVYHSIPPSPSAIPEDNPSGSETGESDNEIIHAR